MNGTAMKIALTCPLCGHDEFIPKEASEKFPMGAWERVGLTFKACVALIICAKCGSGSAHAILVMVQHDPPPKASTETIHQETNA